MQLLDEIDSTNEEAKRQIKSGNAPDFEVIIAKEQTGGKGRYGRSWVSPEGNLYASMIIKSPSDAAQLSFVTAVSLYNVISSYNTQPITHNLFLKWPNDLVLNNKKLAGILLEYVDSHVIIGIGVNLNAEINLDTSTYLKEHIRIETNTMDFLDDFLQEFGKCYNLWISEGFLPIRTVWLQNAYKLGEKITAHLPDKTITGIFETIDDTGTLVLQVNDEKVKITAGEIF